MRLSSNTRKIPTEWPQANSCVNAKSAMLGEVFLARNETIAMDNAAGVPMQRSKAIAFSMPRS